MLPDSRDVACIEVEHRPRQRHVDQQHERQRDHRDYQRLQRFDQIMDRGPRIEPFLVVPFQDVYQNPERVENQLGPEFEDAADHHDRHDQIGPEERRD